MFTSNINHEPYTRRRLIDSCRRIISSQLSSSHCLWFGIQDMSYNWDAMSTLRHVHSILLWSQRDRSIGPHFRYYSSVFLKSTWSIRRTPLYVSALWSQLDHGSIGDPHLGVIKLIRITEEAVFWMRYSVFSMWLMILKREPWPNYPQLTIWLSLLFLVFGKYNSNPDVTSRWHPKSSSLAGLS
jgi:hypothetical protein